jgi:hypothetical protein
MGRARRWQPAREEWTDAGKLGRIPGNDFKWKLIFLISNEFGFWQDFEEFYKEI